MRLDAAQRVKVLLDYMEEQGFSALECKATASLLLGTCMSVPLVVPYRLEPQERLFGPPHDATGTVRADDDDWAGTFTGYSKRPGTLHIVGIFEPFPQVQPPLKKEKTDGSDEPPTTPP